jgi:hypothetical protein
MGIVVETPFVSTPCGFFCGTIPLLSQRLRAYD